MNVRTKYSLNSLLLIPLLFAACETPADAVFDNSKDPNRNSEGYVPESPSSLTATANNAGLVISLAWLDNSVAETGFLIERRIGSSDFQEVARVGADLTGWQDELNSKGTMPHTYRVSALYNEQASQPTTSNVVVFTYSFEVTVDGSGRVDQQVVQAKSADYDYGTVIQLTAVPDQGWVFARWSGAASGTSNVIQVTVDKATTVKAVFERRQYPLTVNVEGNGSVQERVLQSKTTDYPFGTLVELTAQPATGWAFSGWSGDVSGEENPVQIAVDGAKTVTAIFVKLDYPLTVNTEGEGTVSERVVQSKTSDYAFESVVELTAQPAAGWAFTGWSGDVNSAENPVQVTMEGAKTVTATFEKLNYTLTVTVEGEGTVNQQVVQAKSSDYVFGTVVELTATAGTGWSFDRWIGDASGSSTTQQVVMDGPKDVTAIFKLNPVVRDIDNNVYPTVQIGDQTWMAENLRVSRYRDGSEIEVVSASTLWENLTTGAYSFYANDPANRTGYGSLYNWFAVQDERGICPDGWVVPTDSDWTEMANALGGAEAAGSKMKTTGTEYWTAPNADATNSSGFSALPAGGRYTGGAFRNLGQNTSFWSSTAGREGSAIYRYLSYDQPNLDRNEYFQTYGLSVRCLKETKNEPGQPVVNTDRATDVTSNTAVVQGFVSSESGSPVLNRGMVWSTSENPTLQSNQGIKQDDDSGTGTFTVELSGLFASTKYYVRAFAVNASGTGYGVQVSFTTPAAPTGQTITDIDGNVYPVEQIGSQIWMVENLKTSKFSDGQNIPNVISSLNWSATKSAAWSYYENNAFNNDIYGKLYNWYAATDPRGICPQGWQVPSSQDWAVLSDNLGGNNVSGGKLKSNGSQDWDIPNTGATNESGFTALPAGGRYSNGSYLNLGTYGSFWSTSPASDSYAKFRLLSYDSATFDELQYFKSYGFSVRCVKK